MYFNKAWAIEQREFQKITAVKVDAEKIEKAIQIRDRIQAERPTKFQKTIQAYNQVYGGMDEKKFCQHGSTAIIPIIGVIDRYDDVWTALCGGVSVECLMECFAEAMADESVKTILFDINSPGGSIDGPPEFAEMIYRARGVKQTIAYVSRQGDSAAYWIGSACDKIIVQEAAEVGSIGVLICYEVETEPMAITKYLVSSNAGNKVADPETPEGAKILQQQIDKIEGLFIAAVAKHRGTNEADVKANFGKGGVLFGTDAVAIGMADAVGTFEDAINLSLRSTGVNMAGMQANAKIESVESDDIDESWIEKNKPDVYKAIFEKGKSDGKGEGTEEEMKRVADILAIQNAHGAEAQSEALKIAAIKEKGMTAMQAWNKIQTEARGTKVAQVAALMEDAAEIAAIQSGKGDQKSQDTDERAKLLAIGGKQINGGR
jgi:ClpP class serine protease